MRRTLIVGFVSLIALTAAPATAAAGGFPSFFPGEGEVHAVGERVFAWTAVGPGRGWVEDAPYHAYLVPAGGEWPDPPPLPEDALWIGQLELRSKSDKSATARLEFTVPDVAPGDYVVVHCNRPCTTQLGDLGAGALSIVETPLEARLLREIAALREETWNIAHGVTAEQLRPVRERLRALSEQVERAGDEAHRDGRSAAQELDRLEARVRGVESRVARAPWGEWAVAAVIGAALAALLRRAPSRRRPRSPSPEDGPPVAPSPTGEHEEDDTRILVPVGSRRD